MADLSREAEYQRVARSPAAPAGLQQTATRGAAGKLAPWQEGSFVNSAQDWYGGRNVLGVDNGWDSAFMSAAFDYTRDREEKAGRDRNPTVMWNMFDTSVKGQERATGVATWDDPDRRWKRGDVFVNGVKDSNLYDDMDRRTANLLVSDFMFTADHKRRIFSDSDIEGRMEREVTQAAEDMTRTAAGARTAYEFQTQTEQRETDLREGANSGGWAGALATGLTTGGTAAAIAAPTGVGALPAFVGGFLAGFAGGYLNQDLLNEQVARTQEISERAFAKYDPFRATLHSAKEWGGLGLRSISPFSNIWQGAYDGLSEKGSIGDGRSEFYEVDANGMRRASGLVQAIDVGATLFDSVLQFGGPAGRAIYMGSMGVSGVGGFGGNMLTQSTFNLRTGTFDDFEGFRERAAGAVSPLIDVLQMGTAGGVGRLASRFTREREAIAEGLEGTYKVQRAGMEFTRDKATGEILGARKWTLGGLVPSESIWQVPVRWKARSIAMKAGRDEVTATDLFRAAQIITAPQSAWRGALVNGLAEGYEEAWQGVLDPLMVSEHIDGSAVFVQAMYGAAGGIGMSAGALSQRAAAGKQAWAGMEMAKVEMEARLKWAWRNGGIPPTDEEWAGIRGGMSERELRNLAASDSDEAQDIGKAVRSVQDLQTIDDTRSVFGDAFARAVTDLQDPSLRSINPNVEEQLTILAFSNNNVVTGAGMERVERANSAMMSADQLLLVMAKRLRAVQTQIKAAEDRVTSLTAELAAAPAERKEEAQALLDRYTAIRDEVTAREDMALEVYDYVSRQVSRLKQPGITADAARDIIVQTNIWLTKAYDGTLEVDVRNPDGSVTRAAMDPARAAYLKKATTVVFGRHPFIDSGSFAGFLPQVSIGMTMEGAHAAVGIHQGFLKPMQADSDGDRTTTLNMAYLDDETIAKLRTGSQQFAQKVITDPDEAKLRGVEVGTTVWDHGIDMPDGENMRMLVWTEELRKTGTPQAEAVEAALTDIRRWFIDKFSTTSTDPKQSTIERGARNPNGLLGWRRTNALFDEFEAMFRSGDKKALETLRNAVLNEVGPGALDALSANEPVLLALQQYYTTRLERAGAALARLRHTAPHTTTVPVDQRRPDDRINQRAVSRQDFATLSATLAAAGHADPTRDSQLAWYSPLIRVISDVRDNGWTPENIEKLQRLFAAMYSTQDMRSAAELGFDKDPVQARVISWLDGMTRFVQSSADPRFKGLDFTQLRVILAQVQVPAMGMYADRGFEVHADQHISLLQWMLRRSIAMETDALRTVDRNDPRRSKLNALSQLVYDNGDHSYTPKTALLEMFQWLPASAVVGSRDADYIGGNITFNQKLRELEGLHPAWRKEEINRLKTSPAYMREEHRGLGDPPYSPEQLYNDKGILRVNAYTLMVDALETAVNKLPSKYARQDAKASTQWRQGLKDLHDFIDEYRWMLQNDPNQPNEYSDWELIQRIMLEEPRLADMVVAMIPEAAYAGTFEVRDSTVYAAKWLKTMLLERDLPKAELLYFIHKNLAEFNHAGAEVNPKLVEAIENNAELSPEEKAKQLAKLAEGVDYKDLKSRFQQTMFIAAEDPSGTLLAWMIQQMESSSSVQELLGKINKVPALLQNRAELLAYVDDVALFESRPEDLWTMGLTSTKLMENIAKWSERVGKMKQERMVVWALDADDMKATQEMKTHLATGRETGDSEMNLRRLRHAVKMRKRFGDGIGPTARMNFLQACADPFVPMQDKGASPEVARFVEAILTTWTWGVRMGFEQAIDGATAYQWKDIATNPTLLLRGPVQIMLPNGGTMFLDMSDEKTQVEMLADPQFRAFARAVIFNTVRDVDMNGVMQHYLSTSTQGSISQLLEESMNQQMVDVLNGDAHTRLMEAHRLFGMIESSLVNDAMEKDPKAQGKSLLPITKALGEIMVAYTSVADLNSVDMDARLDSLIREMAKALVGLAQMDPDSRAHAIEGIKRRLNARRGIFGGVEALEDLLNQEEATPLRAAIMDRALDLAIGLEEQSRAAQEKADLLLRELEHLDRIPNRTKAQQDRMDLVRAELDEQNRLSVVLLEQGNALQNGKFDVVDPTVIDANRAQQLYMFMDEANPLLTSDELQKVKDHNEQVRLNIRRLLQNGDNIEAFRGKGTPLELMAKLAKVNKDTMHLLHDPQHITAKDWKTLSQWAATVHFVSISERPGTVSLRAMGTPEVDRLYDRSFGNLVDVLFDEDILNRVVELVDGQFLVIPEVGQINVDTVIVDQILSEDRLGQWSSILVPEMLKVGEMIARGPVGLSVAAAGNFPKRLRSFFGTATASTTLPLDTHLSTAQFDLDSPADPALISKIRNGFFKQMTFTVTRPDGTSRVIDVTQRVGIESARPGMSSDFKILRRASFDRQVALMRKNGEIPAGSTVTVDVTYVDPDKKPFTPEYVNSVYFDKAGRGEEGHWLEDVISESVFATGGWSKIGQQLVFDVAARGGSAGFPSPPIPQQEIDKLNHLRNVNSLGEYIRRLADLIVSKQYNDMDPMTDTDQAAVIKLIKQRMLVRAEVEGVKKLFWADEVIAMQGEFTFDPGTESIIELSEEVASLLLSEAGMAGVPKVNIPVLTPRDMWVYPSLNNKRLEDLGLSWLGEVVQWNDPNSPLRNRGSLSHAALSSQRGSPSLRAYKARKERWQQQLSRGRLILPLEQQKEWDERNQARRKEIEDNFSDEIFRNAFIRLGIPVDDLSEKRAMESEFIIRPALQKAFGEGWAGRIWKHTKKAGDEGRGLLTRQMIEDDFSGMQKQQVLYQDAVILDLDEFLLDGASDADVANAVQEAYELVQIYASRGAAIFLLAKNQGRLVKETLGPIIEEGSLGYEPVHNSSSIYLPITESSAAGANIRAQRSMLTEIEIFNVRDVAARLLSDEHWPARGANENVVLVDTTYKNGAPWTRMAQLLAPGDLTIATSGLGSPVSLNYPTPDEMTILQKVLLPLLENDASWQELLKRTNTQRDHRQADPEGVAHYDGKMIADEPASVGPGILEAESARQKLIDLLKSGRMPTVGDEVHAGMFWPLVNSDGRSTTVVLTRLGFKLPDEAKILSQWNRPVEPGNAVRVAMATNEMNDTQTIPPPMRITELPMHTTHGLVLVGDFEHHKWGKWVDAALGFKAGRIKLEGWEFVEAPMSVNGFRPSEATSLTSESGKLTTRRLVTNFRDLFLLTGFDIRNVMVEAFVGPQADQAAYIAEWAKLKSVLDLWSRLSHGMTPEMLAKAMTTDGLVTAHAEFLRFATENGVDLLGAGMNLRDALDTNPKLRIATLAMMTLMAPKMRVENVIQTSGVLSVASLRGQFQAVSLPRMFTDALQNVDTPATQEFLIQLANDMIPVDPKTGRKPYWFDTNFQLHSMMRRVTPTSQKQADGSYKTVDVKEDVEVVSYVQLVKPAPATEDLNAYADANLQSRRDVSLHIEGVKNAAIAAVSLTERDYEKKLKEKIATERIIRFGQTSGKGRTGDLWHMLTRIKSRGDQPVRLTPLSWKYLVDSIEDVRGYCMAFDKSGWDADIQRVRDEQKRLLEILGLTENLNNQRIEVDYLVRQFYGSPGKRKGQKDFVERVSAQDYIEAVRVMISYAKDGRNPLEAGKIPYPHETLWRKIDAAGVWRPTMGRGPRRREASNWEEMVLALFGQVEQSKQLMDSHYRRPMDGFMRTYLGTIRQLQSMPVSGDEALNVRLLDPEANRHLVSIDPGVDELMQNPILLAEMSKTISNMMGLTKDVDPGEMPFMDSSAMLAHRKRAERWAEKREMAPQTKTSYMEYHTAGVEYVEKAGSTHALMTNLVNLSLINRLFNPPLWVSAVPEVWARTALETFTDLLLGDQIRAGGKVANKLARGVQNITSSVNPETKEREGGVRWMPRYNEREIDLLHSLARQLSTNTDFMEFLYKEMVYTHLVDPSRGKLGNFLEDKATKVARAFSDPRWGMPSNTVTLMYLAAALEHMTFSGAQFSVEAFVQQMEQDPLYLVKQSSEEGGQFTAHKAGMNRVAQSRSMKPTTLGRVFTGPIDTLTHGTAGYNFAGHLLKIPFQFANFSSNAMITMMGLGGVDQIFAMYLDGRKRPGFINRMDAHIRGVKPEDKTFDMSDVLEGIDLSRAFIRGGVTQTGLFTAALFASSAGLGGEDDEMRKRRKLAEYLNTPLFLDPREMQNDFLVADGIFLDQIPLLGTVFRDTDMPEGEERSVVVPHWIIRQFTSPMMGTLRFLQTGDTMDIWRGFADAFSVVPNSIMRLWDEATLTADLLFQEAKELDTEDNTVEAQAKISALLINAVSVYEKALLENSFINAVRNGADEYNRNPYMVPATTESGEIAMREGRTDMPLRSKALESYTDENGNVREAYDKRTGMGGLAHAYAENNTTFSILMSLITLQNPLDSTYNRNNMVVAEKTVDLPEVDKAKAEALLYAAFLGLGGQERVTLDEVTRLVKQKYEAAGKRWVQSDVEEEARKIYEAEYAGAPGGTEILGKKSLDLINDDAVDGVYTALRKGLIDFSDGTLAGLWIDMPTRQKLEAEWAEDLIQEGVDMGLGQQAAEYRMKRLMLGDLNNPALPGLREILYSKKIPTSGKARYNQMNMTFMIGPDGRPWATPFKRQSVLAALGIPVPQRPLPAPAGMTKDARGKLVDNVFGINLGMHGLERQLEEPPEMPGTEALDQAAAKVYTPQQSSNYRRWKRFPSRKFGSYGGGGGVSYGPRFERMLPLPETRSTPRPDDIPFINVNTPYVRRARVNTDRIFSERGRLKQWQ